jgi:hypothetical protein
MIDAETAKRYQEMLRESLVNVTTDVPELVAHLKAEISEILELSDLDGEAVQNSNLLDQRSLALQNLGVAYRLSKAALIDLEQGVETEWVVLCAMECQRLVKRTAGWCLGIQLGSSKAQLDARSYAARKAANVLHDKPGGSRDKQRAIREIWASGKYTTRNLCAEEEYQGLEMSYDAARKALRNTP